MTAGVGTEFGVFADGAWQRTTERREIHGVAGERLATVAIADSAQAASGIAASAQHQRRWGEVSAQERCAAIAGLERAIEAHREELVFWLTREAGATRAKAEREVAAAKAEVRFAATLAPYIERTVSTSGDRDQSVDLRPVGVVSVITPFNAPLVLAMRCLAPALAAGNSVVLKPDPRTPVSGGLLLPYILRAAGLPSGLLTVLPGDAAVGEVLCEHPAVGSVLFTGSTPVGRRVGALAGANLKKCGLELGGKNPFIVFADADVEHAAACAVRSGFLHSGQICMAAGRYLVEEQVLDDFSAAFVDRAARLIVGDPAVDDVDMGPLIDESSVDRVATIAEESILAGAELLLGPVIRSRFMRPVVLGGVDASMPIWNQEVFGPVAGIRSFAGISQLLEFEARSPFGLVASVHTSSTDTAAAVANSLRCGTVRVNDVTNHDAPDTPMTGWGESGNGTAFGSPHMLNLLTNPRLETRWTG
ncbi:aldehyde dehydrogenase family protein [Spiractinospora alimapuensis]|uniref:aldehyde dehydrogenase family protein n=1 Tax=Spiractinospora alimapuensis TaxID=2820884 RepID=UPI001F21DC6A|nr:aldehyde dehydrogenase family protein [Spiractinospora alimapuensis]QVQ50906.1 aldehyde dehydrogenase family protein [Spiractinospora alimapuensis]